MAPSVNMAVDLSGSGAVGLLFDDALGLAAVQLLKDPVDVESHIGDRPAESPALDQDGSGLAVVAMARTSSGSPI